MHLILRVNISTCQYVRYLNVYSIYIYTRLSAYYSYKFRLCMNVDIHVFIYLRLFTDIYKCACLWMCLFTPTNVYVFISLYQY